MFYRARVEDNKDPENLQRVRVRVHGVHSLSSSDVPTDVLPWAKPVLPVTSGKIDEGYGKFDVPEVDDYVWVFFEDEEWLKQRPFYFGIIRTPNDKHTEYKQVDNSVEKDRWNNRKLVDKDKTTWHNGKETVQMTVKETGEIEHKMDNGTGKVSFNIDKQGNVTFDISALAAVASLTINIAKDFTLTTAPVGTIKLDNTMGNFTISPDGTMLLKNMNGMMQVDPLGNIDLNGITGNINITNTIATVLLDPSGNINISGNPNVTVVGTGVINLTAPKIAISGEITSAGPLTVAGPLTASGGVTTPSPAAGPLDMKDVMLLIKTHTHTISSAPGESGASAVLLAGL